MPYPPDKDVPNFTVFTGGTEGSFVSPGQYALDWLRSLGGDATVDAENQLVITMPRTPDNTPAQIPDALNALIVNVRNSFAAAIQGKVYPPNSNLPPKPIAPYYP